MYALKTNNKKKKIKHRWENIRLEKENKTKKSSNIADLTWVGASQVFTKSCIYVVVEFWMKNKVFFTTLEKV